MMKNMILIVSFISSVFSTSLCAQEGKLFIIGGGTRSDALMKQLVNTAELRANDYIIVLPMASEEPDTGFLYISRQLVRHTGATIRNFDFSKSVNRQPWIDSVVGARLIYILGGDQNRFMKTVLNTPLYDAIHAAYKNGATIAGTSAGAAVMSRYMITGRERQDSVYKETFDKLWDDNIVFAEGLGLLQRTIIDQHFVKRSRYNRLISALGDKPRYIGIGIDEGTALIVKGKHAVVAGDSQVLRFELMGRQGHGKQRLLTLKNIRLDIFNEGEKVKILP